MGVMVRKKKKRDTKTLYKEREKILDQFKLNIVETHPYIAKLLDKHFRGNT